MDPTTIFAIIEAIIILLGGIIWYKRSVGEEKRIKAKRLKQEGTWIRAKVTGIAIQKNERTYIVKARWYNNNEGKMYYFKEACPFPKGATNTFRPKIREEEMIDIRVAFEPQYSIKRQ